SDDIRTIGTGGMTVGQEVGRDVERHFAARPDDGVPADAAELMDAGQAADDGAVFDDHLATDRGAVDQHDLIADLALMGDMTRRHQEAVRPDAGDASLPRSPVDRDEFPDDGALADL